MCWLRQRQAIWNRSLKMESSRPEAFGDNISSAGNGPIWRLSIFAAMCRRVCGNWRADRWHAIILASAGLERLGLKAEDARIEFEGNEFFTTVLSPEIFVPAGGQGVVAMQIRIRQSATPRNA